jgi:hypothetical protein
MAQRVSVCLGSLLSLSAMCCFSRLEEVVLEAVITLKEKAGSSHANIAKYVEVRAHTVRWTLASRHCSSSVAPGAGMN